MIRSSRHVWVVIMMVLQLGVFSCLAQAETEADKLAVAGKLELDYHAEIMVARDKDGHAVNWNNCGLFMGCFGDFGFDGPKDKYPRYQEDDGGSPAVLFDGTSKYRHFPNPTPGSICDGTFSVEIWAKDLKSPDGVLISWGGFTVKPSDFDVKEPGNWNHLAVIVANNSADYYCNGVKGKTTVVEKAKPEQILVGEKLEGAIAAIRIHNEALTPEQLDHNLKGGIMLGTKFFTNINPDDPNDYYFNDPSLPGFKTEYSKHFRSTWEPAKDEKNFMAERVPKQLKDAELYYNIFEQLGYHLPIVSAEDNLRGDGIKYKIPAGNDWGLSGGGGWMGWSRGYGFSIAGPGWFSGHELGHGTQGEQMRPMAGNFWEVHTCWLDKMGDPEGAEPVGVFIPSAHLFPGNGRNYYHTWQIFDHLRDTPEYGALFATKMWNAGSQPRDNYPWTVGEEIDPDPSTPFSDECVKMARRCITWDFSNHDAYAKGAKDVDLNLYRTILEPVAYMPGWYRVPRAIAPLQWGINFCPLKAKGKEVVADLQGYVNPERGSHWSASFVAVEADGKPRYSEVWNEGVMKFRVKKDDKELYLVVAATPTKIAPLGTCGDYRSDDWSQFPYRVKLEGAVPREVLFRAKPDVPGKPHSNGGGFVADTAHVDATAYVGPNAMVIGNAQVLGKARIEDYAVIEGTVKDNAILTDFAKVEKDTTVRGNAKIRGRSVISGGCDISGDAKVLENSAVSGNSTKVSGYVTIKGNSSVYGGNNRGTAMTDGHYAKGNDLDKGCWFTWSWGAGKNDGEIDEEFGGIYCQYTFEKQHPYLAWDTHGVTWGYLVGAPAVEKRQVFDKESNVLTLNGKNQFVELPVDVADMRDLTIDVDVLWDGNRGASILEFVGKKGDRVVLSPRDDKGKLSFGISAKGKKQIVRAPEPLVSSKWVNIQLMLGEDLATLLVDGKIVASNDRFTLNPDDFRATVCYLGRGAKEGYFKGSIDNFTIYSLALKDKVPPSPNPSEWLFAPEMPSPDKAVMHAVEASDPRGVVEYKFTETTGNPGGKSSDWQKEPTFIATGLQPGVEYQFEVTTRDVNGNVSKPAPSTKVKWQNPALFSQDDSEAGVVVFEAEHFNVKIDGPAPYKWVEVKDSPNCTKGETAMVGLPDTGVQYTPFFGPRMDYNVKLKKPGTYWLWLRGSGPHWRGDSVNIAFDFQANAETPYIDMGVDKFRWQRYNKPITVADPGAHVLTIWMREDGTMLDRLLLTSKEDYKSSEELDSFNVPVGIGPAESAKE